MIAKVEADANPIIWMAFSSDTRTPLEVSDIANRFVKPRLQTLPGAADVRIFGERKFSMRIWLDPNRLAAFRLTPGDVEDALRRQNVEVPSGRIESRQREFTVVSQTDLRRVAEFENVVVRTVNGYPVRIKDVAASSSAAENERTSVRFNGRNAVALGLIKQATANPLTLATRRSRPSCRGSSRSFRPGVTVNIANDTTLFIDRSIESVYKTIAEAVILVALVIFLFLGTVRASVIPLVTIPVCLIGACALMLVAGFSMNTLTLLSLVLAIGLVVDDAIVVLENIYRHIEEGMPPMAAAFKGTREVGFAVIAMTLTLAAVYAPIAFTTGRTGRLFIEFALTLAGAVLVSGFVALTLSPMMCSRLLRHDPNPHIFVRGIERVLGALTRGYYGGAWLGLCASAGSCCWWAARSPRRSYFLWTGMKRELAPIEDRATIVSIFSGPEGASIDYTQRYALGLENIFAGSRRPTRVRRRRQPDRDPGDRLHAAGGLERARAQRPADHRASCSPSCSAFRACSRSRSRRRRSASRPARGRSTSSILSSDSYEQMQRAIGPMIGRAAARPAAAGGGQRPQAEQARDQGRVDRERAADAGVSVESIGTRGRNRAGRAQGHALQARGRAVRRDRPVRPGQAQHARGHLRTSSCAGATTRWCRSRAW